jgi:hypothetical protein|tara:strand:- start:408 stop:698 length:291 start_codon:yes stop_codon:yes gene_type:complete
MNNKALEELMTIAGIEGINPSMGCIAREEALRLWIKEYTVSIDVGQDIIKKSLTDEDTNFIKTHIASNITDELFEDCIDFEIKPTKVVATLLAIKR